MNKEPPQRRSNAKYKVDQLKYDYKHILVSGSLLHSEFLLEILILFKHSNGGIIQTFVVIKLTIFTSKLRLSKAILSCVLLCEKTLQLMPVNISTVCLHQYSMQLLTVTICSSVLLSAAADCDYLSIRTICSCCNYLSIRTICSCCDYLSIRTICSCCDYLSIRTICSCCNQGRLTISNRYTHREIKLKFSALLKDYDLKYAENSKKNVTEICTRFNIS